MSEAQETPSLIGALSPLVGYHLRRASAVFSADFAVAVEGTGMRQVLMGILAVVAASPGINQGAVGRLLGIKRANMVSLITELVDSKLILRDTDPADRRAFALSITPEGLRLMTFCLRRIEAHERRLLEGFTAEETATLLDLLGRIEKRRPLAE